jgi:glucosamine--fructose-6-phosphate aminotransferase (isomerizing)
MCGIVGYIGKAEASPVLLDGLRRLEYRGYDSAGLATIDDGRLETRKCAGRIQNLADLLAKSGAAGHIGISHTRWATHGKPTDANAHPQFDQSGHLAIVHNGVIENYQVLRAELLEAGHKFRSQTDTEVLAHLIGRHFDEAGGPPSKARLLDAVRAALKQVIGTYGIALIHLDVPEVLIGARRGSPLVLGLGVGENFLASDAQALVAHTREAVYLKDYDIAAVERDNFEISSLVGAVTGSFEVTKVDFSSEDIALGEFPHYMLKEIFEQPESVRDAMRGRLSLEDASARLGGLQLRPQELREVDRVILTACGTARHAALVGEYAIETLAHVPVEVEFASEFRYRNMPIDKDTLVFAISQSGETIDTLAAMRESLRKGHRTLGICNNVGSTIARECGAGIYLHAGPEIGVAATKSFTSQVTVLTLIGLLLGRMRNLSTSEGVTIIKELQAIPDKIARILEQTDRIKEVAVKYAGAKGMLFMGRQYNYPVALEGALKMKEITYIQAEGHPSAELKHGVIALVEPDMPSIFIAPDDAVFDSNMNSIEQVKARGGPVIAVATEGRREIAKIADDVLYIPTCPDYLSPLLTVIPLQLLAYHTAVTLGRDVDKPRNLAKSVTVE